MIFNIIASENFNSDYIKNYCVLAHDFNSALKQI